MSKTKIIADLEKLRGHLVDEAKQTQTAMNEKTRDGKAWNYEAYDRHAMNAEVKTLKRIAQTIELIIENNSPEEKTTQDNGEKRRT